MRFALLLLPIASRLYAQVPDTARVDSAVVLPPIEVLGSILPGAGSSVGSGGPARVTIVGRQQLDSWKPRLVSDALAMQPGISSYDDLGTPFKINLTHRGFSVGPVVGLPSGLSVFLDGIRQNEPDAAEVNFDLLPLDQVERIEILSGNGSLLGPNSLGGGINLVTRRGRGPAVAELEASGGSNQAWSGGASLGGRLKNGLDYYLAGDLENEGGWRAATGASNHHGLLNLGKLGPQRGVTFQAVTSGSRAETAGSLPQSLFNQNPRANFTPGDFEDLNLLQFATRGYLAHRASRFGYSVHYRRGDAERFNVNQAPDDNVRSFTENRSIGAAVDWRWVRTRGRGEVSVRAGLDAAVNRVHIRLMQESPSPPVASILTTDVASPSWDAAGYMLADYRIGAVTLFAGARFDHLTVPFEDRLDPSADTSSQFQQLSPRGGVSVRLRRNASVYGSASRTFRAPAVLELACADPQAACPLPFALGDDPPLDPVVATTYEAGGHWALSGSLVSASIYRTEVADDISFIQSSSAIFEGYFANIGRTRREGAELTTEIVLGRQFTLFGSYAYSRASYRSAAGIFSVRSDQAFTSSPLSGSNQVVPGAQMPMVPNHQVKVGSQLTTRYLGVAADLRYVGHQWLRGDEANETTPLADYVVADARAELNYGRWRLNAVISNLFNSKHAIFGTFNENRLTGELERFLTPMHARAVKLTVSWRLGG